MDIEVLDVPFSVCKVPEFTPVMLCTPYSFLARTPQEHSLVCPTAHVPPTTLAREDGWRAFRIAGILDFSLVGILAKVTTCLAEEKIGIFAVSTYNTDYILVKETDYSRAQETLVRTGYTIRRT